MARAPSRVQEQRKSCSDENVATKKNRKRNRGLRDRRSCSGAAYFFHDNAGHLLVRTRIQRLRHDQSCRAGRRARRFGANLRYLSYTPMGSCLPTAVATQVKQALQASSLDPGQVTHTGSLTRTACGGGTASCQTPGGAGEPLICVYYNVQLPSTLSADSGTPDCGVSVQFQYPYQFSLPFTSVNMQKIMLNAGVQMTGEY